MLSFNATPLPDLIAGLEAAGICASLRRQDPTEGGAEYICRRGRVSFALNAFPESVAGNVLVTITADLSQLRWWNFPVLWMASYPHTSKEVRLQRDAFAVLRSLGARQV